MQNQLNMLLEPKTNGPEITFLLVRLLDVNISGSTIKKKLEEHPNYPSLLSISDVLSNYGIENLSLSIDPDKLVNIPTPFITQLKGQKHSVEFFTVVKQITSNSFQYFDPERHKWDFIKKEDFLQRCSGIVLIAEAGENAGEKEYKTKVSEGNRERITQNLMAFWLPAVVIATGIVAFLHVGANAIFPFVFSLLTLSGSIAGFLLIWYELDQYNPVLQQICGATKKVNCGAILQSKASKIAGISWSTIGFTYFMGSVIIQIFWGITNPRTLFISAWLNVLAVPYVFYSIYYQWRIAKQWCVLCLFVQSILVLQLATALVGRWHTLLPLSTITPEWYIQVLTSYAIPFMVVTVLLPALLKAKEKNRIFNELQRLKHNPQIFSALLEKQEVVANDPAGLGIVLGNPNAAYKIIKVCNPYCGPCAKAHVPLEELLHNNPDVQIQILFNVTNNETDITTPPVKHLLAIDEAGGETVTKQALDDWYLAENKVYEVFAVKYPMNGELKRQVSKIDAMEAWCKKTGITFTPTFFVSVSGTNGKTTQYHKLPEMYNVTDLKYFLSV